MKELWLPVVGYEGLYEVSNIGNIRTLPRKIKHSKDGYVRWHKGFVMSKCKNKNRRNYESVYLTDNLGVRKRLYVHRIVMQAWRANPLNLPQVNHKDFDTTNNCVENLEWCDAKYNSDYSINRRSDTRGKFGRSVTAFDKSGAIVGTFGSIREAARVLNVHGQNICAILSGKFTWAKGYTFKDATK